MPQPGTTKNENLPRSEGKTLSCTGQNSVLSYDFQDSPHGRPRTTMNEIP